VGLFGEKRGLVWCNNIEKRKK